MNLTELIPVLTGIAAGKKWQYRHPAKGKWEYPLMPSSYKDEAVNMLSAGYTIRITPWTITEELPGFRPLASGEKWHREDWTEEMLPDGWRPLLEGETIVAGDEYFFCSAGPWVAYGASGDSCTRDIGKPIPPSFVQHRTRRPLPELPDPYAELKAAHKAGRVIERRLSTGTHPVWIACDDPHWTGTPDTYRIKPVMVKLGPADVPPGSAIRHKEWPKATWEIVLGTELSGIRWREEFTLFSALEDYAINRPANRDAAGNPTLWEKCEKEAK